MRIVIDTNMAFSGILNTNSKISRIILQPKSRLNLYSTNQLNAELIKHRNKIKKISKFSDTELHRVVHLITAKIKFINVELIPENLFKKAETLAQDIDIDDTEFIALTEHIRGKLWTGDKELIKGLKRKNWDKLISTEELYRLIVNRK